MVRIDSGYVLYPHSLIKILPRLKAKISRICKWYGTNISKERQQVVILSGSRVSLQAAGYIMAGFIEFLFLVRMSFIFWVEFKYLFSSIILPKKPRPCWTNVLIHTAERGNRRMLHLLCRTCCSRQRNLSSVSGVKLFIWGCSCK